LLQRFNLVRDRADELIRRAERIFGADHPQPERTDSPLPPASPPA
jgi:hypothetical protein